MNPDIIARVAERKIQEAIEEGKFDDLPGKGQPIVFDDDPMTPPHLRMANKILKNAGVLPDWMQLRKEILSERDEAVRLRARLIREGEARRKQLSGRGVREGEVERYGQWHATSRASYLRTLKSVNNAIFKFGLLAPSTAHPFRPFPVDEEMASFDAAFPAHANAHYVAAPEPGEDRIGLREIARERYENTGKGGPLRLWARAARLFGGAGSSSSETIGDTDGEDIGRSDAPDPSP